MKQTTFEVGWGWGIREKKFENSSVYSLQVDPTGGQGFLGCYDLFMGKFDGAQKQKVVLKWMKWGLVLFVIAVFAMYGYFDGYLSRRVVLSEPSLVTTETTAEICYEKSMNIECLEGFGCVRVVGVDMECAPTIRKSIRM